VADAGTKTGEHYTELQAVNPTVADAYMLASLNHNVGHGGTFDYQRSGDTYIKDFRDVSNFNVGLFAHKAGLSLDQTLKLTSIFAKVKSNFGSAPLGHGVPRQTEEFIRMGWFEAKHY
jgi:hypothetical protein